MELFFLIAIAYFLGSIPFGLLIAKLHGKDLRSIGSGNIGATNVSRALGKKWAYLCFVLDVLKGFIPTFIASFYVGKNPNSITIILWLCVGLMAVLGHIFPVYLNFKGGKGVATSLGYGLGLYPYFTTAAVAAFIVWAITVLIWRYVSLASIIGGFAFIITVIVNIAINDNWKIINLWPLLVVAALIQLMIVVRHRTNIKRIIAGTEGKIFQKNS